MALDAATLALTAGELKQTLTDAKIAKIFVIVVDDAGAVAGVVEFFNVSVLG